jgi:type IX secretion system PorP/SprF family membrane protein
MKIIIKYILSHILFIGILLPFMNLNAQQNPIYSQYMFNKFLINPAVAGSEGYTAFNLTAREQWIGFKDAPYTHALSGQTRVSPRSWLGRLHNVRSRSSRASRMSRVGLGGYLFNDHRGPIDQTGVQLSYAYHLPLDEAQLSYGLSATIVQYSINKNKLVLWDPNDDLVMNSNLTRIIPDFNFGVYYTSPDYYAGFSVNQLIQSSLKFSHQFK